MVKCIICGDKGGYYLPEKNIFIECKCSTEKKIKRIGINSGLNHYFLNYNLKKIENKLEINCFNQLVEVIKNIKNLNYNNIILIHNNLQIQTILAHVFARNIIKMFLRESFDVLSYITFFDLINKLQKKDYSDLINTNILIIDHLQQSEIHKIDIINIIENRTRKNKLNIITTSIAAKELMKYYQIFENNCKFIDIIEKEE